MRVHEPLSVLDLLDAGPSDHSWPAAALRSRRCRSGERGAAVLLNCGEDAARCCRSVLARSRGARRPTQPLDLRTYGIGAQILRDLGVAQDEAARQPAPHAEHARATASRSTGFVADEPPSSPPPPSTHAQR